MSCASQGVAREELSSAQQGQVQDEADTAQAVRQRDAKLSQHVSTEAEAIRMAVEQRAAKVQVCCSNPVCSPLTLQTMSTIASVSHSSFIYHMRTDTVSVTTCHCWPEGFLGFHERGTEYFLQHVLRLSTLLMCSGHSGRRRGEGAGARAGEARQASESEGEVPRSGRGGPCACAGGACARR